jgi:hypothetical protein
MNPIHTLKPSPFKIKMSPGILFIPKKKKGKLYIYDINNKQYLRVLSNFNV